MFDTPTSPDRLHRRLHCFRSTEISSHLASSDLIQPKIRPDHHCPISSSIQGGRSVSFSSQHCCKHLDQIWWSLFGQIRSVISRRVYLVYLINLMKFEMGLWNSKARSQKNLIFARKMQTFDWLIAEPTCSEIHLLMFQFIITSMTVSHRPFPNDVFGWSSFSLWRSCMRSPSDLTLCDQPVISFGKEECGSFCLDGGIVCLKSLITNLQRKKK